MIIGIFGESCTGKSAIAEEIKNRTAAQVFAGKDYLRLAKGEAEARRAFTALLETNREGPEIIVYVIAEKEHLGLLPDQALRVLVTADLDLIKERFARRMNGQLPPPIAAMLEKKHGMFDGEAHDLHVVSGAETASAACDRIVNLAQHKG